MIVREYHFSHGDSGGDAGISLFTSELPIGRIEETRKGSRFYYTGRWRSPERIAEFAEQHPELGIYNERGEKCDPHQVVNEIRGMKIGTAGSGSRFGSGLGAPYNDLSAWDVKDIHRITTKKILAILLVISLCFNGVLIACFCWQNRTVSGVGTYASGSGSDIRNYLVLLEDGTYLHFLPSGDCQQGNYTLKGGRLCILFSENGKQSSLAAFPDPNRLLVLNPDGSTALYEKIRYTPSFIEQKLE